MTIHDAVVNWLLESALEKEPLSAKASLEFKSFHQNLLHLHVSYTKDEARAQPISHSRAYPGQDQRCCNCVNCQSSAGWSKNVDYFRSNCASFIWFFLSKEEKRPQMYNIMSVWFLGGEQQLSRKFSHCYLPSWMSNTAFFHVHSQVNNKN